MLVNNVSHTALIQMVHTRVDVLWQSGVIELGLEGTQLTSPMEDDNTTLLFPRDSVVDIRFKDDAATDLPGVSGTPVDDNGAHRIGRVLSCNNLMHTCMVLNEGETQPEEVSTFGVSLLHSHYCDIMGELVIRLESQRGARNWVGEVLAVGEREYAVQWADCTTSWVPIDQVYVYEDPNLEDDEDEEEVVDEADADEEHEAEEAGHDHGVLAATNQQRAQAQAAAIALTAPAATGGVSWLGSVLTPASHWWNEGGETPTVALPQYDQQPIDTEHDSRPQSADTSTPPTATTTNTIATDDVVPSATASTAPSVPADQEALELLGVNTKHDGDDNDDDDTSGSDEESDVGAGNEAEGSEADLDAPTSEDPLAPFEVRETLDPNYFQGESPYTSVVLAKRMLSEWVLLKTSIPGTMSERERERDTEHF